MRISYDREVDAAYIRLSDKQPTGVVEIAEGVNLDMTEAGEITGIEILEASNKFPVASLFRYEVDPGMLPEGVGC